MHIFYLDIIVTFSLYLMLQFYLCRTQGAYQVIGGANKTFITRCFHHNDYRKDTELVLIHSDNARHGKAKGNGAVQMKIRPISGNGQPTKQKKVIA